MALVTQGRRFKADKSHTLHLRHFLVSIAANGDTLVTGFKRIYGIACSKSSLVAASQGTGATEGTITFATGGAVASVLVSVWGY